MQSCTVLFQNHYSIHWILTYWKIYYHKSLLVTRRSADIAKKYLCPTSKLPHETQVNRIKYIIDVAKQNELVVKDASLLLFATNCSKKIARTVIKVIESGRKYKLPSLRKERFDAIHVTQWPAKISEFVLQPENAQATPGQGSLSIRYGVLKLHIYT